MNFFFKGDLLALDIPGLAGIRSCQILISVFIISLFLCLRNYVCWLELVIRWLVFLVVLLADYYAARKNQLVFV